MYIAKLNDDLLSFSVRALRNVVTIIGTGDDQTVITSKPEVPKDWKEISETLASKGVYADSEGQPSNIVPDEIANQDPLKELKAASTILQLKAAIVGLYEG